MKRFGTFLKQVFCIFFESEDLYVVMPKLRKNSMMGTRTMLIYPRGRLATHCRRLSDNGQEIPWSFGFIGDGGFTGLLGSPVCVARFAGPKREEFLSGFYREGEAFLRRVKAAGGRVKIRHIDSYLPFYFRSGDIDPTGVHNNFVRRDLCDASEIVNVIKMRS